jgi:rhodanese-related sulfurtransferase
LKGLVESVTYDQAEEMENSLFLDVRTDAEFKADRIPRSIHIPLDELRERIHELPHDRHLILTCRSGVRSYAAYRILKQSGFRHLSNLSGGYISYCHYTNRTPSAVGPS